MTIAERGQIEVTAAYGDDVILRGLSWWLPDGAKGFDLAKRLVAGRITAEEIVRNLEPLGEWWGLAEQYGGLGEYESHAEANWDPASDMLEETDGPGDWYGATVAVVLVAKRPRMPNGELWDPAIHNPASEYAWLGNSYLPEHQPLEIVEVRYDAGKGYRVLRASGIRTTAAMDDRVYRGFSVELGHRFEEFKAADKSGKARILWDLMDKPGSGGQPGQRLRNHPGVGQHWTYDHEVAITFSGQRLGLHNIGPTGVPVIIESLYDWGMEETHEEAREERGLGGIDQFGDYEDMWESEREFFVHEKARMPIRGIEWWEDGKWTRVSANRGTKFATRLGWLYHVAPRSARESIRQHGLDHTRGQSPWVSYDWIRYPKGTYLFESPEDAQYYADGFKRTYQGGFEREWDIWKVIGTDLDVQPDPLAMPGGDHPFAGNVYLSTVSIPANLVGLSKEAMPSWRDRGERPQAEAVIVPDRGRGRRNSFEVFLYGQPHARRESLDAAKASVEEVYGPLEWAKVSGDTDPHNDPVHGYTTMFNDAPYYLVVDRLPRLGTTASGTKYYHISGESNRASIEQQGLWSGEGGLWLFSDPERVRGVGKSWTPFHPFEQQDVWLVDPVDVVHGSQAREQVSADEWAPDNPVWVTYTDVPPERVHRVDNHTLRATAGANGPLTIQYTHNPVSSKTMGDFGNKFGQDIEPTGKYITAVPDDDLHRVEGWDYGTVTFRNPLVIPWGSGGFHDPDNWKQVLHQRYGKTGKELSKAIIADGYDGIVTTIRGKYGPYGEIVDLTHFRNAKAATLDSWRPTRGMFARGQDTLDPRLFDTQSQEMLPSVRKAVLDTLGAYWSPQYGQWQDWAKVYLAGSGASYWWDSDADLDILIGVDLDRLRQARPANKEVADSEIIAHLNKGLQTDLRPTTTDFLGFEATWFINGDAYDIEVIHPYAAFDITADEWVVKPPVLPANWGPDSIPEETWRRCEQAARSAQEVLSLPEPERTAAGVIYFDWVHEGRRAAYSASGGGWLDPGNVIYQYLTQHPERLLRRLYLCKHPEEATGADAIEKVAATGISYEHTAAGTTNMIVAVDGQTPIGYLSWEMRGDHSVVGVEVDEAYRRQGIATEMWRRAREVDPSIAHSRNETSDGRGWRQSLGARHTQPWRDTTMSYEDLVPLMMPNSIDQTSPEFEALMQSIKTHGIYEFLMVEETRTTPFLSDGHHRLMAGHAAGVTRFPVRVYDSSEAGQLAALKELNRRERAKVAKTAALPETTVGPLYHGTSREAAERILVEGFRPADGRQGVIYLTKFPDLAAKYASRLEDPVVLRVESVTGVSGAEVGYMDIELSRQHGAHFQDKYAELLLLDPSRAYGISIYDPGKTAGKYDATERKVTLEGQEFVLVHDPIRPYSGGRAIGAYVDTQHGRMEQGYLLWDSRGIITDVGVHKGYQRMGLATAMLAFAREFEPGLQHSHALTDDGQAWSQTVAAGLKISYDFEHRPDWDCIRVHDELGFEVGHLAWWHKDNEIGYTPGRIISVEVSEPRQRQGIATEMLRRAREREPRVHHSDLLSEDGKAWSQVMAAGPSLEWYAEQRRLEQQQKARPFTGKVEQMSASEVDSMGYGSNGAILGVHALQDGEEIGWLLWNVKNASKIEEVQVEPKWRYKGVARAMLAEARKIDPAVKHSETLTDDGTGWSQRVGDRTGGTGVSSGHGHADLHRPQAVLAGPAGQDDDGPDQGGRGHHPRRDRRRLAGQGPGPRRVRPPARVAATGPQIAGPLARSFETYSHQTQQQIRSALKALREGRVRPDPKQGRLAGFYSIPFGGTVTSSANRLLLTPELGQWLAVYAVFGHDYDRAYEVISLWLESLHRDGDS